MKRQKILLWILVLLFAVFMSIPFLIPHCGFFALFGIVPLLCMERVASESGVKRVWIYHYSAFVLWNAFTTFWVCNATVGGGLFAVFANALQMSLIFGVFRLSKRHFKGILPYVFLMVMWIAWERAYFDADISWPWLVLGNSFARSIASIQWYEYTGALGGSLWIWACNLTLFGLMVSLSDGSWMRFNIKAKAAAAIWTLLIFAGPFVWSSVIWHGYEGKSVGEPMEVYVFQPNIDPYNKFQALTQQQQNNIIISQMEDALGPADTLGSAPVLMLAPETFTSDIIIGDYPTRWLESHNSALMVDGTRRTEIFHKNKLVVAVEKTPYPAVFCKIDDWLGGVMGRCVGQDSVSVMHCVSPDDTVIVGCAICYESVYGEYYTEYVHKGAEVMTIITNDAWWGNTPGYRQHLSYASLRAIETRRSIARCANTGISCFIDQRGEIHDASPWWQKAVLHGKVERNDEITFFVAHGDIAGRVCTFVFGLLALALFANLCTGGRRKS